MAVSTALILVVPRPGSWRLAAALLISGLASPLPAGWRPRIHVLAVAAVFVAAAILLVVAVGAGNTTPPRPSRWRLRGSG